MAFVLTVVSCCRAKKKTDFFCQRGDTFGVIKILSVSNETGVGGGEKSAQRGNNITRTGSKRKNRNKSNSAESYKQGSVENGFSLTSSRSSQKPRVLQNWRGKGCTAVTNPICAQCAFSRVAFGSSGSRKRPAIANHTALTVERTLRRYLVRMASMLSLRSRGFGNVQQTNK